MAILNKYKKIQDELGIVGASEQIRELIELVISIAPTNISVLITGESGTGKEVFAQAIHRLSPRKDNTLISVNCGAIPEGLLESELFGHERGAFTGAVASKKGYFELADKGTILLDEIGETTLQTQVKLLRVLETGEFMRVGSGELQKVDVRVIAATNRDLAQMVSRNEFRKDLYYRLKAVGMVIPPIRERRSDVEPLIKFFTANLLAREQMEFGGFTEETMDLLKTYPWPGNVREIRHFVETTLVLAKGKAVTEEMAREQLHQFYEPDDVISSLPIPIGRSIEEAERELIYKALVSLGMEMKETRAAILRMSEQLQSNNGGDNKVVYTPYESVNGNDEIKPLDELERDMIERALDIYRGNRRKVATALNISERTLYRKIKEYGLV